MSIDLGSFYEKAFAKSDSNSENLIEEISGVTERYKVIKKIDQGGFKAIHLCQDFITGRLVAVATPVGQINKNSFLREARITGLLSHPNIMPIYDMGENSQGQVFFAMKYIEGRNLLETMGSISAEGFLIHEKLRIYVKVLEALSYAHSKGVVHCDVKPANIQLGDFGEVVLADWGLAQIIDSECEDELMERYSFDNTDKSDRLKNQVKGTPGYMSPELLNGKDAVTERADIYSLGVLLYELLHEREYKVGTSLWNERISGSLIHICRKALKLELEARYQSVNLLLKDIQNYQNGYATEFETKSMTRVLALFYKRNKLIIHLFMVIALISGAASFVYYEKLEQAKQAKADLRYQRDIAYQNKLKSLPLLEKKSLESYKNRKFDDALKVALEIEALIPGENIANSNLLGKIYFLRGDYNAALGCFKEPMIPVERVIYKKTLLLSDENREINEAAEITEFLD